MNAVFISILVLLVLAILCGMFLWKRLDRPERHGFLIEAWSAAFGTLVFGFLVALAVYYIQSNQQSEAEKSQTVATIDRLISILSSEISDNLLALMARLGAKTKDDILLSIYKSPLKYGFWRIVSNSGDMKSIKDLEVIYAVSEAYASIENTYNWENRLLDLLSGLGNAVELIRPDGSKTALSHSVLDAAVRTYEPTKQAAAKAIDALRTQTE